MFRSQDDDDRTAITLAFSPLGSATGRHPDYPTTVLKLRFNVQTRSAASQTFTFQPQVTARPSIMIASAIKRTYQRVHHHAQNFCYWLGPKWCILLGGLILFGSFIIQLLTSIGVPYIKAFDFFRFDLANFTFVELGMWAACNGKIGAYIPTRPWIKDEDTFNCPPASWGWKTSQYSAITDAFFHHNLPKALILHPISCVFTFMAMTVALITLKRQRQHFLLPIFSFFSCLFALLSFIIDVATFVPARGKLMTEEATNFLGKRVISTELGPAFWLSISCFGLDIVGNGIIIAGYGIWRYQRISRAQRRRSGEYAHDIEMKAGSRLSRREYFANESTVSFSDRLASNEKDDASRQISDRDDTDLVLSVLPSERRSGNSNSRNSRSFSAYRDDNDSNGGDMEPYHDEDSSEANDDGVGRTKDVFDDENVADEEEERVTADDGYDSAVSAYDDARSDFGRSSREASRSQVAIPSQSKRQTEDTRPDSPPLSPMAARTVRRKPVGQYEH